MYWTQTINLISVIKYTQWQRNTQDRVQAQRPLPSCHVEWVFGAGICPAQCHTSLSNLFATGSCIILNEWWSPGCPASVMRTNRFCSDSIILQHASGALRWVINAQVGVSRHNASGKLRIKIRNFNSTIYNTNLGNMYIKMISVSSGIHWYNLSQLIYNLT